MKLSNQNKIVVGVIALILALTVGYAIFSETLNIGGTASASGEFSLIFNTVGEIKEVGSHGTTVTGEKTKALDIRNITLEYPSSYVEIPVTIKNVGTIDAKLKGIEVSNLSNGDITVTYSGVAQDEIIKATEKKEMKIKITWNEGSKTTLSTLEEFNIGLKYEQVTGENGGGSNPGGIVFPAVSGKLGDNVNFYYDNGVIDITGSGPMSEGVCTGGVSSNCSLGDEITLKLMETLTAGSKKADEILKMWLAAFVIGNSYEDAGVSKDEFKTFLTTSEVDGGFDMTEDEAEQVIAILEAVPKPKSITIEEGITSLRKEFFFRISSDALTITIPNSVTYIGTDAFYACRLDTLKFGTGITSIEGIISTHDEGNHINNIIIPEGITKLGNLSIPRVSGLKTLTIPSTVTEISASAISRNPDLEEIVNKTGRSLDWNLIINGTPGEAFETGTVVDNTSGKTITIAK